jgi:DNA polymerase-3 subunit gamma/tau
MFDISNREIGGGRVARQSGQVRKEAAATRFARVVDQSPTFSPDGPNPRGDGLPIMTDAPTSSDQKDGAAYRVLARKYRPSTFDTLIGQEAMVRTLSNAIAGGRLAHAFILTGVRGVGKTTTARLIARALNCVGADGKGGPTVNPCGVCDNCRAIAESRHVDVLEMDAASRTGVDDIREIIDGVRYAPASARYKIYIIDEVHMLSRNAFNALLKTLEEPPAHVKFIFATTEIRKVPVTVLSRCQRFDLRRVEAEQLITHFRNIVTSEKSEVDDAALTLIARAAEGSVRDGLSLLDQALAHGAGVVTEEQVRDMLGLADRALVLDLYQAVMAGDVKTALEMLRSQYNQGADPTVILQDMLELTHWLTRLKVVPDAGEDAVTSESERKLGGEMAKKLSMPTLTRSWQMLLKGLSESRAAPSPLAAAEMVLVRLMYASDLPDPADLVRQLTSVQNSGAANGRPAGPSASPSGASGAQAPQAFRTVSGNGAQAAGQPEARLVTAEADPATACLPNPENFRALVSLFEDQKEPRIALHLSDHVHLVKFSAGRLEIRMESDAPLDLPHRVSAFLNQWTGTRWVITLSQELGDATLREQEVAADAQARAEALAHPLVKAVLLAFPGSQISDIRSEEEEAASFAATPASSEEASELNFEEGFGLDDD